MRTPTEIAWCAGFFDAEGCFAIQRFKGQRPGMSLDLAQNEQRKELLDRWLVFLGLEAHGRQYIEVGNRLYPYWRLRLHQHEVLWDIAMTLWSWLSEYRRQQFSEMWTTWEGWSPGPRIPYRLKDGRLAERRVRALQSTCKRGHDLDDPENVYLYHGVRFCRACRKERMKSDAS